MPRSSARRDDGVQVVAHRRHRQAPQPVVGAQFHHQHPHWSIERPIQPAQAARGRIARHARVHDLVVEAHPVKPLRRRATAPTASSPARSRRSGCRPGTRCAGAALRRRRRSCRPGCGDGRRRRRRRPRRSARDGSSAPPHAGGDHDAAKSGGTEARRTRVRAIRAFLIMVYSRRRDHVRGRSGSPRARLHHHLSAPRLDRRRRRAVAGASRHLGRRSRHAAE